jgi:hypothetical protein
MLYFVALLFQALSPMQKLRTMKKNLKAVLLTSPLELKLLKVRVP